MAWQYLLNHREAGNATGEGAPGEGR